MANKVFLKLVKEALNAAREGNLVCEILRQRILGEAETPCIADNRKAIALAVRRLDSFCNRRYLNWRKNGSPQEGAKTDCRTSSKDGRNKRQHVVARWRIHVVIYSNHWNGS